MVIFLLTVLHLTKKQAHAHIMYRNSFCLEGRSENAEHFAHNNMFIITALEGGEVSDNLGARLEAQRSASARPRPVLAVPAGHGTTSLTCASSPGPPLTALGSVLPRYRRSGFDSHNQIF